MYFFRKRYSIRDSKLLTGLTDYHSHILPGVDDGVQTAEEALMILDKYSESGIKKVFLTPHMMEDLRDNQPQILKTKFDTFRKCYAGDMELDLAGEYMLDFAFWKVLKTGEMLTIDNNKILVEFSFLGSISDLEMRLWQIQDSGSRIILAHPERYLFLNEDDFQRLKSWDIDFQLNLFSLAGAYHPKVRSLAQKLLDGDYYNYLGTDTHDYKSFLSCIKAEKITSKQIAQLEGLKAKSL